VYPVQDKNVKRATTSEDIAAVHAKCMRSKFSLKDLDVSDVNVDPDGPMTTNLVNKSPPRESEVAAVVKTAKTNKAADADRITAALLRADIIAMITGHCPVSCLGWCQYARQTGTFGDCGTAQRHQEFFATKKIISLMFQRIC